MFSIFCETDHVSSKVVKKKVIYMNAHEDDAWRLHMGKELLKARDNKDIEIPGFDSDEINQRLSYVCAS